RPGRPPAPLDRAARPGRRAATPGADAARPAAHPTRPAYPHRPPLDAAPARTLALAGRLDRRARTHPRAPRARLSASHLRHQPTPSTPLVGVRPRAGVADLTRQIECRTRTQPHP